MRLSNFLAGMLGCAAIMACSNETDAIVDDSEAEGDLSYIAVNIMNANADTRVEGGSYEDGQGAENAINSVRFYLFDASGNAYNVTNGATGAGSN